MAARSPSSTDMDGSKSAGGEGEVGSPKEVKEVKERMFSSNVSIEIVVVVEYAMIVVCARELVSWRYKGFTRVGLLVSKWASRARG